MTHEELEFAPSPILWTETFPEGANVIVLRGEQCLTLGFTWADLCHLMESFGTDFKNSTLADRFEPTPLGVELLQLAFMRGAGGGAT